MNKLVAALGFCLITLYFELYKSTTCTSEKNFNNNEVITIEPENLLCINGADMRVLMVSSFYGRFEDETFISHFKDSSSTSSKLKVKVGFFAYHLIITKTSANEHMLIMSSRYDTAASLNTFLTRGTYFQHDVECFNPTLFTDITTKASEIETTLGASIFSNQGSTLKCLWFKLVKSGTIELQYNNENFRVSSSLRSNQHSYIARTLPGCTGSGPHSTDVTLTSSITILTVAKRQFCVPISNYMLERLRRTNDDPLNSKLNSYCKYESLDGTKFCIQVGDDFEYALFTTGLPGPHFLVLSNAASVKFTKDPTTITDNYIVSVISLFCFSTPITYTHTFMSLFGVTDSTQHMHCVIPADMIWNHDAPFTKNAVTKTLKIKGCETRTPTEISSLRTKKVVSETKTQCLQQGNSFVKHISATTWNFNLYAYHEDKVCALKYSSRICYKFISDDAKYVFILNEYTKKTTLLHTIDMINSDCTQNFLYRDKYYRYEIVCVPKLSVEDFEKIKDAHYLHIDGNKVIFLIDLMNINDKIRIKSIGGCNFRDISVDPINARPENDKSDITLCEKFYNNDGNIHQLIVLTADILSKCLQLTCSTRLYSFSQAEINTGKGKASLNECKPDKTECIDSANTKSMIYIIQNVKNNKMVFVAHAAISINLIDNRDILYAENYYKYDVVCFRNSIVDGGINNNKFQLQDSTYSCSVVKELPANDEVLTIIGHPNCNYRINLHKYSVNPDSSSLPLETTCSYLLGTSEQKILNVDPKSLSLCITRTCTTITYLVDITPSSEAVIYDVVRCVSSPNTPGECLNKAEKGAIIKVSTERKGGVKILYSKVLNSLISSDFYYSISYGPNKFICFNKDRVTNKDVVTSAGVTIESENRLCIFIDELTTTNAATNVKLTVEGDCQRDILLYPTDDPTKVQQSTDFNGKCESFIKSDNVQPKILSTNFNEIKDCITKLCLSPDYQVMKSNSINNCKLSACNINDADVKYFKIISRYNKRNLFVIPTDNQNDILVSKKSGYYKSSFYVSDIVCYEAEKLRPNDKENIPGYFVLTESSSSSCYILKELASTKQIELNINGQCSRKITLHNIEKPREIVGVTPNLETICIHFSGSTNSANPIQISLENLKKCVRHLCLKPVFIVQKSLKFGDYAAIREECDENSDGCIIDAVTFDYAKLQNTYTNEDFFVQNSDLRSLVISENYFYPSPFYDVEVICIKPSRIPSLVSSLTKLNSYTLGDFKCIIIKELENHHNKIEIDTSETECKRELQIVAKSTGHENFPRTVDNTKCRNFIGNSIGTKSVITTSRADFQSCMVNTCSKIDSRVRINENQPIIHEKVEICPAAGDQQCKIEGDQHFDFIEVTSTTFTGVKYFRFFDSSSLSQYTTNKIEFYSPEYHQNHIVCFKQGDVSGPDNWNELKGVFSERPRICVVSKELPNDIELQYKIADNYHQTITIKYNSPTADFLTETQTKSDCENFFTKDSQTNYHVSEKQSLLNCVSKTRSMVYFFIKLETNDGNFINKKLTQCNLHTDVNSCFTDVTNFDAVKIKSPYRTTPFYARTTGITKTGVEYFKTSFYDTTYYADDVVCVHSSILTQPENPGSISGFITDNGVTCIVVRDTADSQTIQVNVFQKCSKTIYFSRFNLASQLSSPDICSPFYSRAELTTTITMSLLNLRSCILSSCSKIAYLSINSANSDLFTKHKKDCTRKEGFGDISCLQDLKSYFLAKIQRASDEKFIYVQQDAENTFPETAYDSFYFSTKYYKDEVLCVNKNNIIEPPLTNRDSLKLVEKGNKNLVCIIINDLGATTNIKLKTKHGCQTTILFEKTKLRSEEQSLLQDTCGELTSENVAKNSISSMTASKLQECIRKTCSKVLSYVKRNELTTGYSKEKITTCKTVYGDSACIVGTNYDFAYVTNSFLAHPKVFRSTDLDSTQSEEVSKIFDQSVYFDDDIVCQASTLILNLQKIVEMDGVYTTTARTCVLGSKVTKEVKFKLKVDDKCHRSISVINKSRSDSSHPNKIKDMECENYFDKVNTVLVYSEDLMKRCAAHTCGSVTYINQSISDHLCKDSEFKCDQSLKFTYATVESIYTVKPILVMSEDVKNSWIGMFENVEKYKSVYPVNEITCFKKTIYEENPNLPDSFSNDGMDMVCIRPKSEDGELLMTVEEGPKMKLKLFKSEDAKLKEVLTKNLKVSIYAFRDGSGTIGEVFKYKSSSDMSDSKNNVLSDLNELEPCSKNQPQMEAEKEDFKDYDTPDSYAFMISSNIFFKKPIAFLLTNNSACLKYYNKEDTALSKLSLNDEEVLLNQYDCVFVSKDSLTIHLNSEFKDNPINTQKLCIEQEQMTKHCEKIYEYSARITICFISKSDQDDFENEDGEDEPQRPVYVMIKKGNCFVPKIMKYNRVGICQIDDTGLSIKVFDSKIGTTIQKYSGNASSKIQTGSLGYLALGVIGITILYSFISIYTRKNRRVYSKDLV